MKKMMVFVLCLCLCASLFACGKSKESQVVADQITAIGTVTLESEAAILAAEEAYRALSEECKLEITDSAATLARARVEYEELVEAEYRQKVAADSQARVDKVIKKIDAIGEVTMASRDAIYDARVHYNFLENTDEQGFVTNIGKLEAAEEQLAVVREKTCKEAIEKHKSNFKVSTDKIENDSTYLSKKTPKYYDVRCFISCFLRIKNNYPTLVVVYNYTDDDWVFTDKITLLIDGQKYEKTAFEVSRQVGWGDVTELCFEQLPTAISMDSEEIALLSAIANSEETIIRFSGSEGNHDYTVKQTDKDALKETLAFYAAIIN